MFHGQTDFNAVSDLLESAGFVDSVRYPLIFQAVSIWRNNGSPSLLIRILRMNPLLIQRAARLVDDNPYLPFPDSEAANLLSGEYDVGKINRYGDRLGFKKRDFRRGVILFGAPETGKSHLACGIADQILRVSPANRGFSCIFIQQKKDDIGSLAFKYPYLKVINIPDLPYNLWEPIPGEDPTDRFLASINLFAYENYLGTLSIPVLRYAVFEAARAFGVLDGSKKYPKFSDLVGFASSFLSQKKIPGYNMSDTVGRITNRLMHFASFPWLNMRRGVTADFFLENDACLNVAGADESVSRTVIMGILDDVHRKLIREPPGVDLRYLVFIDEARYLFDVTKERQQFDSNRNVESWFTQSRSARIGKFILSQEPGSLPEFVTGNAPFRGVFPLFGEELTSAGRALNLSEEKRDHILKLNPFGQCVFRHPSYPSAFLVEVRSESGIIPGISPGDIRELMKPFVSHLQSVFKKIDDESSNASEDGKKRDAHRGELSPDEARFVSILGKNPFLRKTDLDVSFGGAQNTSKIVASLKSKGYIMPMMCAGKTRKAMHYPLTYKAYDALRFGKNKRIDPSRFEHSLFCFRVLSYLVSGNENASLEYSRSGVSGRIDVYSQSTNTAYEVQFSSKNLVSNAEKCLDDFGCSRLVFVGRTKSECGDTLSKQFWSLIPPDRLSLWTGKVDFVSIQDFI